MIDFSDYLEYRNGSLYRKNQVRLAGCKDSYGYIVIKIKKKIYKAHRIVWYLHHGHWPTKHLDHINGIRDDNRIENLREVSYRQNQQNLIKHRKGELVGAQFIPKLNLWRSRISLNKKTISLGCYETELEAHRAYIKALEEFTNGRFRGK